MNVAIKYNFGDAFCPWKMQPCFSTGVSIHHFDESWLVYGYFL